MKFENLKIIVLEQLERELSEKLSYHGVHHTLEVLKACEEYIVRLDISKQEARLLFTAALLHDTGFMVTYDNHEEASINYANQILPVWEYSKHDIETIAGIIQATKIPQQPATILEQIIGDADLDYLGTDKFYPTGETLYNELLAFNKISNRAEWNKLQISFLQKHIYHTSFAKKYREPIKQEHLKKLIAGAN